MFSRVLLPTDLSQSAHKLVALVSGMDPRPEQICGSVVVSTSGMEQPVIAEHIRQAERGLDSLLAPLGELGITTVSKVLTGRPGPSILEAAKETQSSCILLGSFGKDAMQELLKGSLSAQLTRSAPLPVVSVRFGALWDKTAEQCREMGRLLFSRPLHPTDMSECSQRALELLAGHVPAPQGRIELAHVIDDVYQSGAAHEQEVAAARLYLEEAAARLAEHSVNAGVHLVEGDPVADILRLSCELDASCIVLGSHGKSLVREAVVGSVSHGILRMASVPVVVMR